MYADWTPSPLVLRDASFVLPFSFSLFSRRHPRDRLEYSVNYSSETRTIALVAVKSTPNAGSHGFSSCTTVSKIKPQRKSRAEITIRAPTENLSFIQETRIISARTCAIRMRSAISQHLFMRRRRFPSFNIASSLSGSIL